MSRIGKKPIDVPSTVSVTVEPEVVRVSGPRGNLEERKNRSIDVKIEGEELLVTRPTDRAEHRALHGLTRSLVANMVEGVTSGFTKTLEIQGVGYRAILKGRDLADGLLVDAAHDDQRRRRHLELDSLRRLHGDGVREAESELDIRTLGSGTVADSLDFEPLLVALGDALDHVRDQRAGEAVERAMVGAVRRSRHDERGALVRDRHVGRQFLVERALGALDRDPAGRRRDLDAVGHGDGETSDAAHDVTTRTRALLRRCRAYRHPRRCTRRSRWR